ncbi:hypothetical protein GGX14DRAFT_586662 [Mycena pura]|uniref:Uncharacterized protein n=1 Tax=Mycena pura TaxID=153505 RepID=A0AAD6VR24_9AGAR|nr:hypothetical protein GGX14DRAFT_586662 [Mycena pura]
MSSKGINLYLVRYRINIRQCPYHVGKFGGKNASAGHDIGVLSNGTSMVGIEGEQQGVVSRVVDGEQDQHSQAGKVVAAAGRGRQQGGRREQDQHSLPGKVVAAAGRGRQQGGRRGARSALTAWEGGRRSRQGSSTGRWSPQQAGVVNRAVDGEQDQHSHPGKVVAAAIRGRQQGGRRGARSALTAWEGGRRSRQGWSTGRWSPQQAGVVNRAVDGEQDQHSQPGKVVTAAGRGRQQGGRRGARSALTRWEGGRRSKQGSSTGRWSPQQAGVVNRAVDGEQDQHSQPGKVVTAAGRGRQQGGRRGARSALTAWEGGHRSRQGSSTGRWSPQQAGVVNRAVDGEQDQHSHPGKVVAAAGRGRQQGGRRGARSALTCWESGHRSRQGVINRAVDGEQNQHSQPGKVFAAAGRGRQQGGRRGAKSALTAWEGVRRSRQRSSTGRWSPQQAGVVNRAVDAEQDQHSQAGKVVAAAGRGRQQGGRRGARSALTPWEGGRQQGGRRGARSALTCWESGHRSRQGVVNRAVDGEQNQHSQPGKTGSKISTHGLGRWSPQQAGVVNRAVDREQDQHSLPGKVVAAAGRVVNKTVDAEQDQHSQAGKVVTAAGRGSSTGRQGVINRAVDAEQDQHSQAGKVVAAAGRGRQQGGRRGARSALTCWESGHRSRQGVVNRAVDGEQDQHSLPGKVVAAAGRGRQQGGRRGARSALTCWESGHRSRQGVVNRAVDGEQNQHSQPGKVFAAAGRGRQQGGRRGAKSALTAWEGVRRSRQGWSTGRWSPQQAGVVNRAVDREQDQHSLPGKVVAAAGRGGQQDGRRGARSALTSWEGGRRSRQGVINRVVDGEQDQHSQAGKGVINRVVDGEQDQHSQAGKVVAAAGRGRQQGGRWGARSALTCWESGHRSRQGVVNRAVDGEQDQHSLPGKVVAAAGRGRQQGGRRGARSALTCWESGHRSRQGVVNRAVDGEQNQHSQPGKVFAAAGRGRQQGGRRGAKSALTAWEGVRRSRQGSSTGRWSPQQAGVVNRAVDAEQDQHSQAGKVVAAAGRGRQQGGRRGARSPLTSWEGGRRSRQGSSTGWWSPQQAGVVNRAVDGEQDQHSQPGKVVAAAGRGGQQGGRRGARSALTPWEGSKISTHDLGRWSPQQAGVVNRAVDREQDQHSLPGKVVAAAGKGGQQGGRQGARSALTP